LLGYGLKTLSDRDPKQEFLDTDEGSGLAGDAAEATVLEKGIHLRQSEHG
jgi:hypothetical protein